jgi:hypothetical protein
MKARNQQYRRQVLRSLAALSLAGGATAFSSSPDDGDKSSSEHVAWVAESLKRIMTVKPGMNRDQLMRVFSTEGGISTALWRTFVSRDCPLFKVDVTFHRAPGFDPNASRDQWMQERDDDLIDSVSRPYLQFSIMD